jgi:O-antigen/teichoic acid export membrane protein
MSADRGSTEKAILQSSTTLGRSTATGFLWLMLQSLSGRATGFLSQLVLARLLMPDAFGRIGLAYTVTTVASAVVSFGIDDILLQRLRKFDLWVGPSFWSSLILSLIGMVLMLLAAPVAASFYHTPGLVGLIAIMAINLPIGSLSVVPAVKLRAQMNFRYLATYTSAETLAMQVATIVLAALGFGAYSFVIPLPVAAAVKVAVFWHKAPARITLRYHRAQIGHILSSGFLVVATRMVVTAVTQGDTMVLGLMATDAVVGVYFFAFRLAAQPLRMLAGNFGNVLFPAFTQLRTDPVRQIDAALRASRILAYTVTPVCFMQAAVAAPVLHLMFGARWDGAIPLVQILSLGLPGDAVAWVGGALLVARREFRRDFVYIFMFAIPFFVMVVAGAELGSSLGVAIAVSLYYALVKPINSWLVFRESMRLGDVIGIYVTPPLTAGIACGAADAASWLPAFAGQPLVQIAVILLVGPLLYVLTLRLLMPTVLREVLARFPVDALLWKVGRRLVRRSA